jgi:hypothetical protein
MVKDAGLQGHHKGRKEKVNTCMGADRTLMRKEEKE